MVAGPTILAIASPPGRSLRGIIRISGPDAFAIAGVDRPARGATPVQIRLDASRMCPAWLFAFPAPRSYTGEDSLELQLPGNPVLLDRVIARLLSEASRKGIDARQAEPGEFTARAFFNNRLNLTQAEGVAATIAAQSDAELAAARMLTAGRLGSFAHELADDLAAALALVEAGIDFTDQEDVVAIAPDDLHQRLSNLHDRLASQLSRAVGMEQLRAIPWVALVGQPNAGKSALFNALLGRERAVVSNVAGTTRDVLAEPLAINTPHGRAEVMLVDLAGVDDVDASAMNQRMQSAARQAIDRAELRICCTPLNQVPHSTGKPDQSEDRIAAQRSDSIKRRPGSTTEPRDEIVVLTKVDLRQSSIANRQSPIAVSALTGEGLPALRAAIADRLADRAISLAAGALALQPRHEHAMHSALTNLEESLTLVQPQQGHRALADAEIVASSMRAALNDLASLAGDITPDDILGRIFAGFCIGK